MFDALLMHVATVVGVLYLLGALAVRWTFRFAARCQFSEVPLNTLPVQVADLFRKRIPEIQELGFELAGCYACGALATETHSYVAYFCNRGSNDFANVSATTTTGQPWLLPSIGSSSVFVSVNASGLSAGSYS